MKSRKFKLKKIKYISCKLSILIIFLASLFIGIGYSALFTNLAVGGQVKLGAFDGPMLRKVGVNDTNAFWESTYRTKIKRIILGTKIAKPANSIKEWDVGSYDGVVDVMAYLTTNSTNSSYYDLYIQGDGHLYANYDSSYLFSNFTNLDEILNLELLDTSKTTSMNYMFYQTGYYSNKFTYLHLIQVMLLRCTICLHELDTMMLTLH